MSSPMEIPKELPVMIAGGGIGGLVLALELQRVGVPCVVFEAVAEPRPLGVGINLMPSAVKVLDALGLAGFLKSLAVEPATLRYANKFGQIIWEEPRGRAAGYDHSQYSLHRGQFQMCLLEEVRRRLGHEALQCGRRVASYARLGAGVRVRFADGGTCDGRALVGADGLHSVVRARLYPGEGPPVDTGRVLWRAVSRCRPFLDGRTMLVAGHQYQKLVCYPLTRPDDDGFCLLNWVARLHWPPGEPRPAWSRDMTRERLAEAYAGWNFGWLDVPAMIRAAEFMQEHPMVDREPLERWSFDAVTLLGDAAHPMFPIGSNGGTQAILDAHALAGCLVASSEPAIAFAEYEALRRPVANGVVLANRRNGPEHVLQIAEDRAPHGFDDIEEVMTQQELLEYTSGYQRVAGFTREAVNRGVAP